MSDIFKLRVCIGDANIELEGDGNLVHTIFSELREDGLGKLSAPIKTNTSQVPKETADTNAPIEVREDTGNNAQQMENQLLLRKI